MRYYNTGNAWWIFGQFWGLAVPVAILLTGLSARMRDIAKRVSQRRYFILLIYFVLFSLFTFACDLPFDYFKDYVRPHEYGLSDQTFSKWITDKSLQLALGLVGGALFVWIPFWLIRKSPDRWWLWTSIVAVPIAACMIMIVPVFISPLFNDFAPMKDVALEAKILALADRAGIEGSRVFEVNKSVDTNAVNAYVTGLGGTKRIVLWDTIIAKLSERQLLVVMGHEMGHYVLGHVRNGLLMMCVSIPTLLYAAHRVSRWAIARFHKRFGFTELADPAALPLILLIVGVLSLIASPAFNALTRYQEHESDRFGLEITHDNYACASAFATLQKENLANPRPGALFKLFRASHPPLGERIDFCNEYRPWETGAPQRYADRFRD